jgi:hypothetical protein
LHHQVQTDSSAGRPIYPITKAYYDDSSYVGGYVSSSAVHATSGNQFHASPAPPSDPDASPQLVKLEDTSSEIMSRYVTFAEHVRIRKQTEELSLKLTATTEDKDQANKACRDLAARTYHERVRLTRELEAAKKAAAKAVREKESIMLEAARDFLAIEINKARMEICLPTLTDKEMNSRLRSKCPAGRKGALTSPDATLPDMRSMAGRETSVDESAHSLSDLPDYSSIGDEVDQLIEEEMEYWPVS